MKAKASCYTTAPSSERFSKSWNSALQNVKQLIKSKKRYGIKNGMLNNDGIGIEVRHACFEVSHDCPYCLTVL